SEARHRFSEIVIRRFPEMGKEACGDDSRFFSAAPRLGVRSDHFLVVAIRAAMLVAPCRLSAKIGVSGSKKKVFEPAIDPAGSQRGWRVGKGRGMVAGLMVVSQGVRRLVVYGMLLLAASVAVRAATIQGFSPDRGVPGTEVTSFGTGLQTAIVVYFGSTEAAGEVISRSATSVLARVPPNALTGQISIFTSGS